MDGHSSRSAIRTHSVSSLLALLLLLNAAPSAAAQALGPSFEDGAPGTVLPASPPAVDPLDVPQGGGLPEPQPQTGPGTLPPGVLAAGNPPLTQHTADGFAGALMWLLDAPLTEGQRQDLQDTVVQTWTGGDQAGMSTVLQLAPVSDQLDQLSQAQRIALRNQVQPQFTAELRQAGDPFSRWMLGVYDSAHQPIAPGTPPLTREVSDANAEVMYFLLQVVASGDEDASGITLDTPVLDAWTGSLAAEYPSYSPEQQRALSQMPLFRAAVVEGWPSLPADQKAQLRDAWRPIAQGFLASASCQAFVGLARNGLVEPDRRQPLALRRVWRHRRQLARPARPRRRRAPPTGAKAGRWAITSKPALRRGGRPWPSRRPAITPTWACRTCSWPTMSP